METSKRIILVGALLCSLFAYTQSRDTHLGRAVGYVNKGDYTRADKEIRMVQYWGCEEEHAFEVTSMERACAYLQHCSYSDAPQAAKDSMAIYLIEACGNKINALSAADNRREAERICLIGLQMCELSIGKTHQDYAVLLLDMSLFYQQRGDIKQAAEYGRRAVQVYQDNHLPKNEVYVTIACLAGGYYGLLDEYTTAYLYINDAYKVCLKVCGKSHPYYPTLVRLFTKLEGQLGNYYLNQHNYEESIAHYRHGLILCDEAHGKNEQYAVLQNNLADVYKNKGDFTNALTTHRESLALRKKLYGEQHYEYAVSLNNIATTYMEMGEEKQAIPYLLQTKQILERLNKRDDFYATTLGNLGNLYHNLGNFKEAEAYFSQALDLRKRLSGEYSAEYAQALNNIAALYYQINDLAKARRYYERALAIYQSIYGNDHEECAATLCNLGTLYSDIDEYDKAENYLLRSLAIRQKTYGKDHLECANSLNNLGLHYERIRDYHKALKYLIQAWLIRKEHLGVRSTQAAITLNNIGSVYEALKDYSHAAQYYNEAYGVVRQLCGEEDPLYITTISNVGYLYYLQGDYKKAEPYLFKSYNARTQQFLQTMEFMTESQREKFWQAILYEYEYSIPNFTYDFYEREPRYTGVAYDNQLFYKGALLQSVEAVKRSVLESGDAALIREWNALSDLRKEIIRLQETDSKSSTLAEYEQRAEQLEKHLTQSSAAYRANKQQWEVKWQDVQRALQVNEVAIEFVSILRDAETTLYCALLLRRDMTYPKLITLFDAAEMEEVLQTTTPDEQYDYNQSGWRLNKMIWSKILPYLHYGNTIYYAATGVLHQIAIETLPFNATESMASMFHMVRLSSTRELAMHHLPVQRSSAALYGGIYYDLELDDLLAQSESYTSLSIASTRAVVDESMRAGVHYLPGTKREVEAISAILRPNHINTRVYTSGAANEESFKALSGRRTNILHIATHGFYWTDSTAREQRYFSQRTAMLGETTMSIDPLTRSGLLFAGANIALRGHSRELPQNVQDGIMTSKEISLLDLRGADLVILSACETGKGEITGEGVFGLQRAFKMAGAQTILMSLWPVDDEATQMMTTEFYRHWIERQENKREAFLHAQEAVRARYPQPKYWAAFILLD